MIVVYTIMIFIAFIVFPYLTGYIANRLFGENFDNFDKWMYGVLLLIIIGGLITLSATAANYLIK